MGKNVVGWFEVPVVNMERAITFYQNIFGFELERHQLDGLDMAWFPYNMEGTGSPGSLICQPERYKPSADGALLYFTSPSGNLDNELSRVEAAGGKVIQEKKQISEDHGYMGVFFDTEGNRLALHSRL